MAVAHTTVGFKGSVGQVEEAQRLGRLGPRFTVGSATDWRVSAAAGDRTVSVAAGSGQAGGVQDRTLGADVMQQLPATTGSNTRYDVIVNRFKWTDPVTPPAFDRVVGLASGAVNLAELVRIPGTQYDGALAVVRVAPGQGALSANDVFDVRVWGNEVLHVTQLAQFRNVIDVDPSTPLYVGTNKAPALQGFEFFRSGVTLTDGSLENQGFASSDVVSDTGGFYAGSGANFVIVPAAFDGQLFDVTVGITLNGRTSGRLYANLYRSSGTGLRAESYTSDTAWSSRVMRLTGGQAIALNAMQESGGGNNKTITGLTVSAWLKGS